MSDDRLLMNTSEDLQSVLRTARKDETSELEIQQKLEAAICYIEAHLPNLRQSPFRNRMVFKLDEIVNGDSLPQARRGRGYF